MITEEREAHYFRIDRMYQAMALRFKELNEGEFGQLESNGNTASFHECRKQLLKEFADFERNDMDRTMEAIIDPKRTDMDEVRELDKLMSETLAFVGVQPYLPSVDDLINPRGHLIENVHSGGYPTERTEENDHWLLTDDGFLEFHGGGWIKDKYGYIIGSDNEKMGSTGIQSGIEDLYGYFSLEETQDDIIDLMLVNQLDYFLKEGKENKRENWYWGLKENGGKRIPIPQEISDFLSMRNHNIEHNGSYTALSFLPGGTVQQGFSTGTVSYVYMNTSAGNKVLYQNTHVQLKYVHNGVDITGSGMIKSPGYYKVIQKAGHRLTLERVGTDRHTTIRHLDPTSVSALPSNKIFKPGDNIISYPTTNNGPGSGIHIHVEENHLSGGLRCFCDPNSHSGAYPGSMYYIRYIIKKDGKEINLPEIFNYSGETYRYYPSTKPR